MGKPIYEGVKAMLKGKPGRAALYRAALICAFVCGVGCGDDDDSTTDGGGSDEDSGHEENPPRPDSGRPQEDGGRPNPMDAGGDATDPTPDPDGSTPDPDGSTPDPDAGEPDAGPPLSLGGLTVSATEDELEDELDLFGAPGHKFWLEINDEQLQRLNNDGFGGPFPGGGGGGPCGDIYCPGEGSSSSNAIYADHVLVQDSASEKVADYGKVEVRLVGESTFKQLTASTIPNVRIDTNEFTKGKRIGTFEHMRLNNGLVGSIFREGLAHRIYRSLGYPGLRSSFAFMGTNVWGDNVWTPMVLMEMYKRRFCTDHQDLVGGTCENMWEFPGDIGQGHHPGPGFGFGGFGFGGGFPIPEGDEPRPAGDGDGDYGDDDAGIDPDTNIVPADWCQVSECDNSRLAELMTVLQQTERGPGFKDALAAYIDWDRFHQFQCLNWIMWVGDDPLHNSNNNLIIERVEDGKFLWAPYSVDISAGQDWYQNTTLTGSNSMASGCQADPDCWADTIAICEDLIMAFDDLNPEEMVDETVTLLTDLGMMRYGDEDRAEFLRSWFVERQQDLAEELERYRILPDQWGNCPGDYVPCNDGTCATLEECMVRCGDGMIWCDAYDQCRYPWDGCPSCDDEAPYYCDWTGSCVQEQAVCEQLCNEAEEYEWCEAYNACWHIYDGCPSIDDDGGVPMSGGAGGVGGGIGGMGGMPIPID